MYSLNTPIDTIRGVGPQLASKFAENNIFSLKDLLLFLPIRYSDRSEIVQIKDLEIDKLVTFKASIANHSGFYKNRRRIDSATAIDETGKVKLMWFNNKFINQNLKNDSQYMISGKLTSRNTIVQPTIEIIKAENIHTGRLVPIYSSTIDIPQGSLRRILHHAVSNLKEINTKIKLVIKNESPPTLQIITKALSILHFPDNQENIITARELLAIEELLSLIKVSELIKNYWKNKTFAANIQIDKNPIPNTIPFSLTSAQNKAVGEILSDLQSTSPMNRVLIGDVGSGKTIPAGIAALQVIKNKHNVAFIAPTKILSQQHYQTLNEIFPEINIELLTGERKSTKKTGKKIKSSDSAKNNKATLYIGTHAVINKLEEINPALIIYDEQHRFGVKQRSNAKCHTLTMTATPIPRSLMLTIFSHLSVSYLDELPSGRIPTKTWLVPENKRQDSYSWIMQMLTQPDSKEHNLALIVCPFIDPSSSESLENVASAKETFEKVKNEFKKILANNPIYNKNKLNIELLHGRMKKDQQSKIIKKLYQQKIDILVTTPIVEVGVDLPTASIIVIEASERFGLASLHQLRGRVGRAGQQGYCILFTNSKVKDTRKRLHYFSKENSGIKLANQDLKNRGSGEIFGVEQSGFSELKYASWTNLELINKAKSIYKKLPKDWQPFFEHKSKDSLPLAN
jgi:ATP-dependent DNA helicase RecG